MFNILSGLQEGSHSVMITQRTGPAGLVKGTLVMAGAGSGNAGKFAGVVKADNATVGMGSAVEFVWEDLTTQTSGAYTVASGKMEAETDQVSGTPAAGTFLKPGTGATAGLLLTASMPADASLVVAQVKDSYTIANDAQALSTSVYRITVL
jgi:hypothetical protein